MLRQNNVVAQPLSKLLAPLARGSKTPSARSSVELLDRHGFVRQAGSGIFDLLPLGVRVQRKLTEIVRKHLDRSGCTELELSTLVNPHLWHTSGRLKADSPNEEFMFTDDKKHLLAPTGEEQITYLVGSVSYRQLPLSFYQISRKFRNELRPRGGLLRTREFLMKDLYTFDIDDKAADESYNRVAEAYRSIFEEIGIPFEIAIADSGGMGGSKSHEYHFISDSGEDTVAKCDSCGYTANLEAATAKDSAGNVTSDVKHGDSCINCGSHLQLHKCIEIGHTFHLGDRYTLPFRALASPPQGSPEPIKMGCYGIGITRIIGAVAEKLMDDHGLVWPKTIAPFQCVAVGKDHKKLAEISQLLAGHGIEVAYDDRTTQIGYAMSAARGSGYPFTLVLGRSWDQEKLLEILPRTSHQPVKVSLENLPSQIQSMISQS